MLNLHRHLHVPTAARLLALAVLLLPVSAHARRPFEDTDLFTGHAVRQSSKDRKVAVGVNIHTAPVPYVARKALEQVVAQAKDKYPQAGDLVEVLKRADVAKVNDLAQSGNIEAVKTALRDGLQQAGVTPTAQQSAAIDAINAQNISQVALITQIAVGRGSNDEALSLGIEPWAEYNFGTYDLTAALPIAAFRSEGVTDFALGNLQLDLRAGSRRSAGMAGAYLPLAIGWTAGLSLYAPTGTEAANKVALGNPLALPKYLHQYLTVQPYAIFAAEASILAVMLRMEYSHMAAVRGTPQHSSVGYLNWGASAVLRALVVDIVGELDGLVELYNAPAMNDIYGTAGLRLNVGPVRLGLGARMPLTSRTTSAVDQSFGVSFANISKLNLMLQGIVTF
jgi:hypothetical protein